MSQEDLAAKMKVLVKQYQGCGQSRKAFASSHGISESKLTYWIKKLSKGNDKTNNKPVPDGFVPVQVKSAPLIARDHLVIRLGNGIEIEIPL